MKKRTMLCALSLLGLAFVGCDQVSPLQENSDSAYESKMSDKSRASGWTQIDVWQSGLRNGRDIAAAHDVAVISQDGKSIWFKDASSSTFIKIPFTASAQAILDSDPAVKIEMGIKESRSLAKGVGIWENVAWFSTESGALYEIEVVFSGSSENWYLDKQNENAPTVDADFCLTKDNRAYLVNANSIFEKVGDSWKHRIIAPGMIEAISDKQATEEGSEATNCLTYVTETNTMRRMIFHPQYGYTTREINTDGMVVGQDIEQAFSNNRYSERGYATFVNNSNEVIYRDYGGAWKNLGGCRKIAIDVNKVLWDAYGNGIWRCQL